MDLGDGTPQAPIPSATILMLRDGPGGIEVFLVERHGLSEVHGGAYVFPGGKLDAHDADLVTRLDQAPAAPLQEYWGRGIQLAPPQIMSLAALSRHREVSSVLAEARSRKPPRIQPEVFHEDGVQMLCYPGDERHSIRSRVMPGPTRLC